jgi:hypothetical protein
MRSLAVKLGPAAAIALLYVAPTPCWAAAKLTCLTGTDPVVASDLAQITGVRAMIEAACGCSNFDGSSGKTHAKYVACASSVITTQSIGGQLRKQCKTTVKRYYSASTCGVLASKGVVPCIKKTASGRVSCSIKPTKRCGGSGRVACPAFTTCVDAADTNADGLIKAPGDSGACAPQSDTTPIATPSSTPTGTRTLPPGVPTFTSTRSRTTTNTPTVTRTNTPTSVPTSTPTPCTSRFCDNGDGTITDTQTGLMWEKKGDNGDSLHDKDLYFQWAGRCSVSGENCQPDTASAAACATATGGAYGCAECGPSGGSCTILTSNPQTIWTWMVHLNTTNFAGHTDWRIATSAGCCGTPTGQATELESIQAAQYPNCLMSPCVPPAFDTNCTNGCSSTTCSCTGPDNYWSASSYYPTIGFAWDVDFATGGIGAASMTYAAHIRGVRGP